MAPWTRGLLKNLAKRLVTSSRSAARNTNASTFVKHLTSLLLNNLWPGILIFLPSEKEGNICLHLVYDSDDKPCKRSTERFD